MHYYLFDTKLGWMGVAASPAGLRHVTLPCSSPDVALEAMGRDVEGAVMDEEVFGDLPHRLQRHMNGERVSFPDKMDYNGATPFQIAVWEAARSISLGETRSYGWVAASIGKPKAPRAAGQALGANRLCIVVPCHRVIGNDGGLCGFGGNLPLKQRLLELESKAYETVRS